MTVGKEHRRLKLGKSAAFVKTHLKQAPQAKETWEADFRALPKPAKQTETHYLGLVVALPKGDPLVYMPVEYTPTVNDLADLLAKAMNRPLTGSPRRPERIHLRGNPRWEELFRHLNELGIEVAIQDELLELEEVHLDFLRQMGRVNPAPIIMLSRRPPPVAEQFPAISRWVQERGRIEIGRKEAGFVVRAMDDGGPVFEDDRSKTLTAAMAALEAGLTRCFGEEHIDLE